MENGLFIVGNKRSGSTQLMRLLNLHPKIFVSNESDAVWITYNFENGVEIENYEHDSPGGLQESLPLAGDVLSKDKTAKENYLDFQKKILKEGFKGQKPSDKINLEYIGDQKPYQQADPELMPFILEMFPKAKFIHLVRHPFEVITSSMKFLGGTGGYIWKGMNPEEIFLKWVMHEENVHQSASQFNLDILRVYYGDLVRHNRSSMKKIFDFLELESDTKVLEKAQEITRENYKPIQEYPVPNEAKKLMKEYGFKESFGVWEKTIYPKFKQQLAKITG